MDTGDDYVPNMQSIGGDGTGGVAGGGGGGGGTMGNPYPPYPPMHPQQYMHGLYLYSIFHSKGLTKQI